MPAEYNITLQATLLSENEKKWLVTSVEEKDIPAVFVVDENLKNALLSLAYVFKAYPKIIQKCLLKHYKALTSGVHSLESEISEYDTPPQWALVPIIGITREVLPDENDECYKIEYIISGEAARFFSCKLTAPLYEAVKYIAEDYSKHPFLWYSALTKYISKFGKHLKKEAEADA